MEFHLINGVNAGRNRMEATYKGGLTRIKNGNAGRMSRKVKGKGGMASLFGGAPSTCVSMCIDDVENWFSENE